jgi:CheY-like chemotaxis protein
VNTLPFVWFTVLFYLLNGSCFAEWLVENTENDLSMMSQSSHRVDMDTVQLKFLVVDDAFVSRKLVSRLLNPVSRKVQTAENGEVAVKMVLGSMTQRDPFDVVLIDYNMPVMNGYDAIVDMRAMRFDGFIIGVTAGGHEEVSGGIQILFVWYLVSACYSSILVCNSLLLLISDMCSLLFAESGIHGVRSERSATEAAKYRSLTIGVRRWVFVSCCCEFFFTCLAV